MWNIKADLFSRLLGVEPVEFSLSPLVTSLSALFGCFWDFPPLILSLLREVGGGGSVKSSLGKKGGEKKESVSAASGGIDKQKSSSGGFEDAGLSLDSASL